MRHVLLFQMTKGAINSSGVPYGNHTREWVLSCEVCAASCSPHPHPHPMTEGTDIMHLCIKSFEIWLFYIASVEKKFVQGQIEPQVIFSLRLRAVWLLSNNICVSWAICACSYMTWLYSNVMYMIHIYLSEKATDWCWGCDGLQEHGDLFPKNPFHFFLSKEEAALGCKVFFPAEERRTLFVSLHRRQQNSSKEIIGFTSLWRVHWKSEGGFRRKRKFGTRGKKRSVFFPPFSPSRYDSLKSTLISSASTNPQLHFHRASSWSFAPVFERCTCWRSLNFRHDNHFLLSFSMNSPVTLPDQVMKPAYEWSCHVQFEIILWSRALLLSKRWCHCTT